MQAMITPPYLTPSATEKNDSWLASTPSGLRPASPHKSWLAGANSLLLHTVIISALVWLTPFSSSSPTPNIKARVINASLYTYSDPVVAPQQIPVPNSDKSPRPQGTNVPLSGLTVNKDNNTIVKAPTLRAASGTVQTEPPRQTLSQSAEVPVLPSATSPSLPSSSPLSDNKSGSVRQATASYFSAAHARQRLQHAQEAAHTIQQRKTTRILTDPRTVSQLQQLPDPAAPVSVNCTGNINKTLAFISQYTQGRVRCSEVTQHLQHTIDSRVKQHSAKR